MMTVTVLSFAWGMRLRLRAEGDKLYAEGTNLYAEGNKLWAEGYKLWAEGNKLRAEGTNLRAEGDKLWAEAIIAVHGNIKIEWTANGCRLETGEEFTESATP